MVLAVEPVSTPYQLTHTYADPHVVFQSINHSFSLLRSWREDSRCRYFLKLIKMLCFHRTAGAERWTKRVGAGTDPENADPEHGLGPAPVALHLHVYVDPVITPRFLLRRA